MFKYDFECKDCKCQFEWYVSYEKRNDPLQCPMCPSFNTIRLISQPLVFTNKGADESNDPGLNLAHPVGCGCGCYSWY